MDFSNEFKLLLLCSKSDPSPRDIRRMENCLDQPLDFNLFKNLVERHRLSGPVYKSLKLHLKNRIPETELASMESLSRLNTLKTLRNISSIITLSNAFSENGIKHLLLKGAGLGHFLYGNAALRHSGDIDILIHENQFPEASAILKSLSYEQVEPRWDLTPETLQKYKQLYHHVTFRSSETRSVVELHWRFSSVHRLFPLTFDEALSHCQPVSLNGHPIPILSDIHNLLFLFCHGANHTWTRLFWLKDIDDCLAKLTGLDISGLLRTAESWHLTNYVLEGFYLSHRYFDTPVPEPVRQRLKQAWSLKLIGRIPVYLHSDNRPYLTNALLRKTHSFFIKQTSNIQYAFLRKHLLSLALNFKSR